MINSQSVMIPEINPKEPVDVQNMKEQAAHLFSKTFMKTEKPEDRFKKAYEQVTQLKK